MIDKISASSNDEVILAPADMSLAVEIDVAVATGQQHDGVGRLIGFHYKDATAVLGRVTQLSAVTKAAWSGPQSDIPAKRIAAAPAVMRAALPDQMVAIAKGFTSIGK